MRKTKIDLAFEVASFVSRRGLLVMVFAGRSLTKMRKAELQDLRDAIARLRSKRLMRMVLDARGLDVYNVAKG